MMKWWSIKFLIGIGEELKDSVSFFKKNWRFLILHIFAIIIIMVFSVVTFPRWPIPDNLKIDIAKYGDYEDHLANIIGPILREPEITTISRVSGSVVCTTYTQFYRNTQEWILRSYEGPNEDGFYCTKENTNFITPPIWRNAPIPADFESITISARVINKEKTTSSPPLVFFLGEDPAIWELHAFNENPQIVSFKRFVFNSQATTSEIFGALDFETPGRVLTSPLQYDTQIDLEISPVVNETNEATFVFSFSYLSSVDGKTVTEPLDYVMQLPFPNPKTAETKVGFGTSKTACIKPIKFTICERKNQ